MIDQISPSPESTLQPWHWSSEHDLLRTGPWSRPITPANLVMLRTAQKFRDAVASPLRSLHPDSEVGAGLVDDQGLVQPAVRIWSDDVDSLVMIGADGCLTVQSIRPSEAQQYPQGFGVIGQQWGLVDLEGDIFTLVETLLETMPSIPNLMDEGSGCGVKEEGFDDVDDSTVRDDEA